MVEPYIEALSFIGNNESILKEINSKPELKNKFPDEEDFCEYIKEKINKYIYNYNLNSEIQRIRSENMKEKPHIIFNTIFSELHNLFGGKKKENNELKSPEMNDNNALDEFRRFEEEDKTIISELFYGEKRIESCCVACKLRYYSYIYQRTINLNMDNYKSDFDLEDEIQNLIIKENNKEFCSICATQKKFNIRKTIVKMPKIIVIVIKRNNLDKKRINYDITLLDGTYKLVGIESTMTPKSNIFGLLFRCFKQSPKKYQYIDENEIEIKMDQLKKEYPYVLYYRRIKKKKKKKTGKKIVKKENNIISNDELINEKIDNNIIIQRNNKIKNINSINNQKNNINDTNKIKKGNRITLYFNFPNGKNLYIDTNDNKKFKEILQDFEKKYNIKISNIKYNDIKININKTPSFYKMEGEISLNVLDEINV